MHVYPWQKQFIIKRHFVTYHTKMFLCCLMNHHGMQTDVVVTELLQAFLNLAQDGGKW